MSATQEDIVLCFACGNAMSVATLPPYSRVACPSCGQENRIKKQFGPYTVTKRHALGGMSSVFAAVDSTLNREVALKILSEEYSKDERRIAAFEDEARLTASFSHPHVVRILTTGRAFGLFYIAMEFVPGGHLERRINEKGKLTEAEVLPLAIQIAEGLKGAQSAGLIHRDIKPGNILFDAEGNAKIVDFGLALVTKGGEAKADEIWATPYYVPPEAIEGGVEDFRSDIYAFGATLYHALAGVPSCNEDSMDTKLLRNAKTKVIPLKRVAPEVSYETCAIVDRAMSYEPRNRFRSYNEMIIALEGAIKVLENGGVHAAALQAHAAHRMQVRAKQRQTFLTVAAAVLGLAVLIVLMIQFINSESDETSSTVVTSGHTGFDALDTNEEVLNHYVSAKKMLRDRKYTEAEQAFLRLFANPKVQEPTRSWAGLDAMVSSFLDGRMNDASRHARTVKEHVEKRNSHLPSEFTSVVVPSLGSVLLLEFKDVEKMDFKTGKDEYLMACLIYGLKNWEQGGLKEAVPFFEMILHEVDADHKGPLAWYRPLAEYYLSDYMLLTSDPMTAIPATPNNCKQQIEELERMKSRLKTKGRANFNIDSKKLELAQHAKYLEKLLSGN